MNTSTNRKAYDTDITDEQWQRVAPLIPPDKPGGRPRTTNLRQVINAILYLNHTRCAWRYLPDDFPPPGTVYAYYRMWNRDETLQRIQDRLQADGDRDAEAPERNGFGPADSQGGNSSHSGNLETFDGSAKGLGHSRYLLMNPFWIVVALWLLAGSSRGLARSGTNDQGTLDRAQSRVVTTAAHVSLAQPV